MNNQLVIELSVNLRNLINRLKKVSKTQDDVKLISEYIEQYTQFQKILSTVSGRQGKLGIQQVLKHFIYIKKLFKFFSYQSFLENEYIMKQDDAVDTKIYLILNGRVNIQHKNPSQSIILRVNENDLPQKEENTQIWLDQYGQQQSILNEGDIFVQQIQKKDQDQQFYVSVQAQVISNINYKTKVHLLLFDKDQYNKEIQFQGQDQLLKQTSILSLLPSLDEFNSQKTISNLIHLFEDQKYYKNNFIIKYKQIIELLREGELSESLYFLVEGRCIIYKDFNKLHQDQKFQQINQILKPQIPDRMYKINRIIYSSIIQEDEFLKQNQKLFDVLNKQRIDDDDIVPESYKIRKIPICDLINLAIVGDETLQDSNIPQGEQHINQSIYSVQVLSQQATVYSIKTVLFQKYFPELVVLKLKQIFNQKEVIRKQIYQEKINIIKQEPAFLDLEKISRNYYNQGDTQSKNELKNLDFFRVLSTSVKDSLLRTIKMKNQLQEINLNQYNQSQMFKKEEIKQQNKFDHKNFCTRQPPQRIIEIDQTVKNIQEKRKQAKSYSKDPQKETKITMGEFVKQQKLNPSESQKTLFKNVENPYDFASNVNSDEFLKQYYSSLIFIGLVKPQLKVLISIDYDKLQKASEQTINRHRISTSIKRTLSQTNCGKEIKYFSNNGISIQIERNSVAKNQQKIPISETQLNIKSYSSSNFQHPLINQVESRPFTSQFQTLDGQIQQKTIQDQQSYNQKNFQIGYSYKDKSRIYSGLASQKSSNEHLKQTKVTQHRPDRWNHNLHLYQVYLLQQKLKSSVQYKLENQNNVIRSGRTKKMSRVQSVFSLI